MVENWKFFNRPMLKWLDEFNTTSFAWITNLAMVVVGLPALVILLSLTKLLIFQIS